MLPLHDGYLNQRWFVWLSNVDPCPIALGTSRVVRRFSIRPIDPNKLGPMMSEVFEDLTVKWVTGERDRTVSSTTQRPTRARIHARPRQRFLGSQRVGSSSQDQDAGFPRYHGRQQGHLNLTDDVDLVTHAGTSPTGPTPGYRQTALYTVDNFMGGPVYDQIVRAPQGQRLRVRRPSRLRPPRLLQPSGAATATIVSRPPCSHRLDRPGRHSHYDGAIQRNRRTPARQRRRRPEPICRLDARPAKSSRLSAEQPARRPRHERGPGWHHHSALAKSIADIRWANGQVRRRRAGAGDVTTWASRQPVKGLPRRKGRWPVSGPLPRPGGQAVPLAT